MTEPHQSSILSYSTLSGAIIAWGGALSLADWLAISGVVIAAAGLLLNWRRNRQIIIQNDRLNALKERELDLKEQEVRQKWAAIKQNGAKGKANAKAP
jgi:hypothetical protein